jgi:hypothetical protein
MPCMIRVAFAAFGLALPLSHAWAASAFDELSLRLPCSPQVRAHISTKLRGQWKPSEFPVISHEDYPDGITLRDTIEMKAYDIGALDNKTVLIEYPIYQTRYDERWSTWDADKNCVMDVSSHPGERGSFLPSFALANGFSDQELTKLLNAHAWGAIYLTNFHPAAIESLKELRSVVAAKGGHLTVVLYEDYLSHPGAIPASAMEELLKNGGIAAAELKPLASTELYIRARQSDNYPRTLVYLKGFLSNRVFHGPYKSDQYQRLVQDQLDGLTSDLK